MIIGRKNMSTDNESLTQILSFFCSIVDNEWNNGMYIVMVFVNYNNPKTSEQFDKELL